MKRFIGSAAVLGAALVASMIPGANATPAATQENVRFITNVPGSTGGHVVAEGDRLYVGAYGLGLTAFDISDRAAPVKIGEYKPALAGQITAGDPGVRADTVPDTAVWNGRHIVSLGGTSRAASTTQTEFLDFTDPANPVLLHRFSGSTDGEAHNGDIVDSRKLWLPSGGSSGNMLRIYDMNPLLNTPAAAPTKLFSGNLNTMWNASRYKAAIGGGTNGSPTHVHDLEVYTDYRMLLLEEDWVDQNDDGIPDPTYDERDLAFVAASQGYPLTVGPGTVSQSAVVIVDITNPSAPEVVNKIQMPGGQRYNHEVQLLASDPHIMFTADEDLHNGCDAGGVRSYRLSEGLTEATLLDTWFIGTGTPAAVCSSHVFSTAGDYVFMGSYNAGLQVIDFRDPENLTRAGQYIAEGANSWAALYYDGYVYMGDFGPRGLDVLQFIAEPARQSILKVPNPTSDQFAGVSETVGECNPDSPADSLDGMAVPIPAGSRGEGHTIYARGTDETRAYDLDIWFYDSSCEFLAAGQFATAGDDEQGPIPANAAYAYIDLWVGRPQLVYAQIDPSV